MDFTSWFHLTLILTVKYHFGCIQFFGTYLWILWGYTFICISKCRITNAMEFTCSSTGICLDLHRAWSCGLVVEMQLGPIIWNPGTRVSHKTINSWSNGVGFACCGESGTCRSFQYKPKFYTVYPQNNCQERHQQCVYIISLSLIDDSGGFDLNVIICMKCKQNKSMSKVIVWSVAFEQKGCSWEWLELCWGSLSTPFLKTQGCFY